MISPIRFASSAAPLGSQVDSAVGEFLVVDRVPQVVVVPAPFLAFGCHEPAKIVIRPAWVEEIVTDIAVLALADEHGLVYKYDGCIACHEHTGFEDVESQVFCAQIRGLQIVETGIGIQVFLTRGVHLGNILVDAGGSP